MDFFTFFWISLMGIMGLYLGLRSLLQGHISTSNYHRESVPVCQRPSTLFYILTIGFLFSGLGLISLSLYLYV